ncbi:uncharacterized protein LOC100899396 [Galendromus occidentalis]|uniref:E3 SUMO-protein ligase NSE2 n=1 Tax=Galendromus occidentalis TaxID=34638 RepID=A0AAJ6QNV8_9ACAR|nr:uncharacterized protein LOC100899396 [Galendromus occidentalis]
MTSRRIELLGAEYRSLIASIQDDMQLICTTVAKTKKVLKETPELFDEDFKNGTVESLRKLNDTRLTLEAESRALATIREDPGSGEISKNLEDLFKKHSREKRAPHEFPELARFQSIFDGASSSAARKSSGTRKSRNAAVEVVEEEPNIRMDPLTRGPIKVPVRNKRCKHYYCYETIINHIKSHPYPRCPIAGCRLPHILEDDLEFV